MCTTGLPRKGAAIDCGKIDLREPNSKEVYFLWFSDSMATSVPKAIINEIASNTVILSPPFLAGIRGEPTALEEPKQMPKRGIFFCSKIEYRSLI